MSTVQNQGEGTIVNLFQHLRAFWEKTIIWTSKLYVSNSRFSQNMDKQESLTVNFESKATHAMAI